MFILPAYSGRVMTWSSFNRTFSFGLKADPAKTPFTPCLTWRPSGVFTPNSLLHSRTRKKSSTSRLLTSPDLHSSTYVVGSSRGPGLTSHSLKLGVLLPITHATHQVDGDPSRVHAVVPM